MPKAAAGKHRYLAQFCSDWRGRDRALQILQLIRLRGV